MPGGDGLGGVHALNRVINGHVRECLARGGRIHTPSMQNKRLVSGRERDAEKALAATARRLSETSESGSVSIGGDGRQMIGVIHTSRCVLLDDGRSGAVTWKASEDRHASGRDRGRAGLTLRKL